MAHMKKPGPTKRLDLHITQEIIDQATRKNSTACVNADALKVAVPGGVRPQVDLQTMSISVPAKGVRYHWLTPRAAQSILLNFDAGAQIQPTTIRLSHGWTTPINVGRTTRPGRVKTRTERKQELETMEAAGTLPPHLVSRLAQMRATDERHARGPTEEVRMDKGARPPRGTLSNVNGRKYGLRLAKLTEHGEALMAPED